MNNINIGNIYVPLHYDLDNRGCEGIEKGTIKILDFPKNKIIVYTRNKALDEKFGLDNDCTLIEQYQIANMSLLKKITIKIFRRLIVLPNKRKGFTYNILFGPFIKNISSSDLVLLTGGDMLCYGNNEVNYLVEYFKNKGINSILWGCSVDPNNMTKEKLKALNNISAITTRESLTYDFLVNQLKLNNVYLFPDPAFCLKPEKIELPQYVGELDCIGINLSNFVGKDVGSASIFGKNIRNLISYIINNTNFKIVMVPHVFWEKQDDRIICNELYNEYKESNRIYYFNSESYNYLQIRYLISKFRLFIGARTHAMISAYSMCIPSLALGYSIKSVGIAKDLGMPNETIVDCVNLKNEKELVTAFKYLLLNESDIRNTLENFIPQYCESCKNSKEVINKYF